MSEQELKLHVPTASRQAVLREIKQREATRIRLHAMYFDTPERELARARIAIRLRQEGRDWVQTLKMPGINAITRIELNHPRPGPVLDLSVYAGTEVEAALAAIKGELGLRYETDVQRMLRKVRTRYGTVELAYDTGILRAGALELPISELEFELVSGRPPPSSRSRAAGSSATAWCWTRAANPNAATRWPSWRNAWPTSTPSPAMTWKHAAPRPLPCSGRRAAPRPSSCATT